MNRFPDTLDAQLTQAPDGGLVVAFSGGLDSTVLLHALARQPAAIARGLRAVHVDHGLHPDSAVWADHCRRRCDALAIALNVVKVDVVSTGDGPEAAARRARWQAFEQAVDPGNDILILAHHRDDQAETLLMRLLRGAGPAGLAAMRPLTRRDSGLHVWRPLLGTGQPALAAWAREHGLVWVEDPSNQSPRFDRNHLRHAVMPALRQRWHSLDVTLAQAAERQAEAFALEQAVAQQLLRDAATADPSQLHLPPLQSASRHARWAALRHWLAAHGAPDLGAARLQQIDNELIGAAIDATPRLHLGERVLRRYRDTIHVLAADADQPLDYRFDWDGLTPLTLPDGVGTLTIDPVPAEPLALVVTTRQGGESLRLRTDGPSRPLRLLLQETGVPPWQRARAPVLWLDGEPAAFADLIVDARLKNRLGPASLRLRPQPSPSATTGMIDPTPTDV